MAAHRFVSRLHHRNETKRNEVTRRGKKRSSMLQAHTRTHEYSRRATFQPSLCLHGCLCRRVCDDASLYAFPFEPLFRATSHTHTTTFAAHSSRQMYSTAQHSTLHTFTRRLEKVTSVLCKTEFKYRHSHTHAHIDRRFLANQSALRIGRCRYLKSS